MYGYVFVVDAIRNHAVHKAQDKAPTCLVFRKYVLTQEPQRDCGPEIETQYQAWSISCVEHPRVMKNESAQGNQEEAWNESKLANEFLQM